MSVGISTWSKSVLGRNRRRNNAEICSFPFHTRYFIQPNTHTEIVLDNGAYTNTQSKCQDEWCDKHTCDGYKLTSAEERNTQQVRKMLQQVEYPFGTHHISYTQQADTDRHLINLHSHTNRALRPSPRDVSIY